MGFSLVHRFSTSQPQKLKSRTLACANRGKNGGGFCDTGKWYLWARQKKRKTRENAGPVIATHLPLSFFLRPVVAVDRTRDSLSCTSLRSVGDIRVRITDACSECISIETIPFSSGKTQSRFRGKSSDPEQVRDMHPGSLVTDRGFSDVNPILQLSLILTSEVRDSGRCLPSGSRHVCCVRYEIHWVIGARVERGRILIVAKVLDISREICRHTWYFTVTEYIRNGKFYTIEEMPDT